MATFSESLLEDGVLSVGQSINFPHNVNEPKLILLCNFGYSLLSYLYTTSTQHHSLLSSFSKTTTRMRYICQNIQLSYQRAFFDVNHQHRTKHVNRHLKWYLSPVVYNVYDRQIMFNVHKTINMKSGKYTKQTDKV